MCAIAKVNGVESSPRQLRPLYRYLMFKLINVVVFLQIITQFEFDACNMFQKSWDRGN